MQKIESAKSAKEIVAGFTEALERKDFKTVRSYISDNGKGCAFIQGLTRYLEQPFIPNY
jgi:hypothetical protein